MNLRQHPTRLARLAAVALTAPLLASSVTACATVTEFFGPRPDPALVQLAAQAEVEGRQAHADALYGEVARLCGTDESGASPASCEVDRGAARERLAQHPAPDLLDAPVPAESRALVLSQAIDLAAHAPVVPAPDALDDRDEAAQAAALLEWEYEYAWALDFARAFADGALEATIDAELTAQAPRIEELTRVLETPPSPAPGYQPTDAPLPQDAASATAYVAELDSRLQQRWAQAAAEATAGPWQDWLVSTAASLRA